MTLDSPPQYPSASQVKLVPEYAFDPTDHHQVFVPTTLGLQHRTNLSKRFPLVTLDWDRIIQRQCLTPRPTVSVGTRLTCQIAGRKLHLRVLRLTTDMTCLSDTPNPPMVLTDETQVTLLPAQPTPETSPRVGGYDDAIDALVTLIRCIRYPSVVSRQPLSSPSSSVLSLPVPAGCLVTGPQGVGKLTLIRQAVWQAQASLYVVSIESLLRLQSEDLVADSQVVKYWLRGLLTMAQMAQPAVVVLHHLDLLQVGGANTGNDDTQGQSLVQALVDEFRRVSQGVFVVGTCTKVQRLPPDIAKLSVFFGKHIDVPLPGQRDRRCILAIHWDRMVRTLSPNAGDTGAISEMINSTTAKRLNINKDHLMRVSRMTTGYTAQDLVNLCRQVVLAALRLDDSIDLVNNSSNLVDVTTSQLERLAISKGSSSHRAESCTDHQAESSSHEDWWWVHWKTALDIIRPSQAVEFETRVPTKSWSDVGGYDILKKRLRLLLELVTSATAEPLVSDPRLGHELVAVGQPQSNHCCYTNALGLRPPSGILLYGPPGCGKTLLAQVIANETGMNTIVIKGPEVFSKYFGATEATLRKVFQTARSIAPCVIWMDEMDALARKREWSGGEESGGVEDRVLSTLLNEMDGVQNRSGVLVVGCTTYPSHLDDAILRPGRFDQLLYVGMPDLQDRRGILELLGQHRHPLDLDTSLARLAARTEGFTASHLETLFREAGMITLRKDRNATVIGSEQIERALSELRQTVDNDTRLHQLLQSYQAFHEARS
ncbi:hypothetical protein IWQ61_006968 [Dispira simplex]|nr:hypothetical protein IWQ61_006968 [Dispira simplex]